MAGTSDSGQGDDQKLHVEQIIEADDARKTAPDGETEAQRKVRESLRLRPKLRAKVEELLAELNAVVPGLTAAQTRKLLASRDARDALDEGQEALGRVDDFLQSVTGERNPTIATSYGVYGENPTSYAGVLRALELSVSENARIAALPENAEERDFLFTPVIEDSVQAARDKLAALITARLGTRADLSRKVHIKDELRVKARGVIGEVRQYLYANLPKRKKDPDLRDYGFRPLQGGGGRPTGGGSGGTDAEEPAGE